MSGPRSKDCFFFSTTDYNYTIAFPQEFSYQVYIQASPLVNTLDFLTQWVRSISSAVGFGNTETHTEVCYRREVSILGYTRPCF